MESINFKNKIIENEKLIFDYHDKFAKSDVVYGFLTVNKPNHRNVLVTFEEIRRDLRAQLYRL